MAPKRETRSTRWRLSVRVAMGLSIVALVTMAAVIELPAVPQSKNGSGPIGGSLIGEHSASGERQVDAVNAFLRASQVVKGEHAGLSLTEYEAGASLDEQAY
jgi:hypothetical protein